MRRKSLRVLASLVAGGVIAGSWVRLRWSKASPAKGPDQVSRLQFPRAAATALAVVVLGIVLMARVREYTLSDPQLALLTSQALWERHSLNLRPELDALGPRRFAKDSWKYAVGPTGEVRYIYPLGTSLLALPVVAVGRTLGHDLARWDTDRRYQIGLAALSCAAVFALLANIGWLVTRSREALLFGFAATLGSSLMSTLGSALWSFDFELVFALLGIRELALADSEPRLPLRAFRLGIFLAVAWVCRPSILSLTIPLAVFLLAHGWRMLARFVSGTLLIVVPFLWLCRILTGSYFTSYYAMGRWAQSASLSTWPLNLEGILVSPARGLFVFTPCLLLGVLAIALPSVRRRPLARLLAAWAALTIAMVATQGNWWGGWSFGPRLLTEAVPGLALLGFLGWNSIRATGRRRCRLGVMASLGWGIFVHTYMGLFAPAAYYWNDWPNIDERPEFYRRIWRFPQFFATGARNAAKADAR